MTRPEVFGEADRSGDIDAGGAAQQQALIFHQVEQDGQSLGIVDLVGAIDRAVHEVGGDPPLADALGDRRSGRGELAGGVIGKEGGAMGIGEADLNGFVLRFQRHADAGQGAARADRADEAIDFSRRVGPDLGAGGLKMALAVGDIIELVGPNRAIVRSLRNDFSEPPGIFNVIIWIGIGDGGNFDELRARHAQRILLFLRLRVGNDDDSFVAQSGGDHGEPNAGVAGRAFDDAPARLQAAGAFGIADHRQRGAVFDRAAGVHEFGLAENRAARRLGGGPELYQWRMANGVDDG